MRSTRTPEPQGLGEDAAVFDWGLIANAALFVLGAPRRHKKLASACFITAVSLSIAALTVFPVKYRADAVVLARPNQLTGALSNSVNRELDTPTRFARETLLKRENLRALAEETRLVDRYVEQRPFAVRAKQELTKAISGKEPTYEQRLDGLVDTLESRLMVEVDSDTVRISFQWWDPEIAYEIVQGALQNFLEKRHASEIRTIGEAIAIFETHRAGLEAEINEHINRLERLRDKEKNERKPAAPAPIASAGSSRDTVRLESTLAARRQAASNLESFRQQRLAQLHAELTQQETMFAADHPTLASTRRVLQTLSEPSPQLQELNAEVEQLERQLQQRRASTGTVASVAPASRIEMARAEAGRDDPRAEFELRQMELLLDQHWNLIGRINASKLEMETAKAAFDQRYSVLAPPQVPTRPVKPYRMLFALGGLVGGIALALFAATVADLRGGLLLERWQVERQLNLPVLVEIPRA